VTDPQIDRKIDSIASELADLAEMFPEVWEEGDVRTATVERILKRTEEILLEPVPDFFDDAVLSIVQPQGEVEG
jgi:hypothetical protein